MAITVELYPVNIEQGQFELVPVTKITFKLSEDTGKVTSECSSSTLPDAIHIVIGNSSFEFVKSEYSWIGTIANPVNLLEGAYIEGFQDIRVIIRATRDELLTAREKIIENITAARDTLLQSSDYMVVRHRDELDAGLPTTLTDAQYSQLLAYRQSLRDFPETVDFDNIVWPTPPSFL